MEPSQREELSRWAESLEESEDDDLRAAGRGIRALSEANRELRRQAASAAVDQGEPRATSPLDPGQCKELERWARTLARADVAELRAAGRAIRGLCAEHESLERGSAASPRTTGSPAVPSEARTSARRAASQ